MCVSYATILNTCEFYCDVDSFVGGLLHVFYTIPFAEGDAPTALLSECPLFRVFSCSLVPSPLRLRREKVHSATVPFICPTMAEGDRRIKE